MNNAVVLSLRANSSMFPLEPSEKITHRSVDHYTTLLYAIFFPNSQSTPLTKRLRLVGEVQDLRLLYLEISLT